MVIELDEINRKIISLLNQDARMSISGMSTQLGLSRPTVAKRLGSLIMNNIIKIQIVTNISKITYKLSLFQIAVQKRDDYLPLMAILEKCTRVLIMSRGPKDLHFLLMLWGENLETINSTVESLQSFHDFEIVFQRFLGTPIKGDLLIDFNADCTEGSCGQRCGDCVKYHNNSCMACPATTFHKSLVH
jgi:DNA-binding Lrp family transcriptional regulator